MVPNHHDLTALIDSTYKKELDLTLSFLQDSVAIDPQPQENDYSL